jgi:hypothetical protein
LNNALASGMTLKAHNAAPFCSPVDPVVLVANAGFSSTLDRNGPTADAGLLFCRYSGQTITSLDVAVAAAANLTVAGSALVPNLPANAQAPLEITDLTAEQLLLDTSLSPTIAAQALRDGGSRATYSQAEIAATIAKQQTVQWNANAGAALDQQSIAELAGLAGTVPCRIAVDPWTGPWIPLYLDWELTWVQSHASDWSFNGTDFEFGGAAPDPNSGVTLSGRTLLTPMAAANLYNLMEAYGGAHPEDTNADLLAQTLEMLADADLLSQRLSGFGATQQSLAINQITFLPDGLGDAFGINPGVLPNPFTTQFWPVRHGHFGIDKLWIVDAFGQAFPIRDNVTGEAYPRPLFAPTIVTTYTTGSWGRLPPRVVQPSRLAFDAVDAVDPTRVVGLDPRANPICGWLLPNHLDQSISVYDADGTLVGELALSDTATNGVQWLSAPGGAASLGAPPAIADPTMLAMVGSYLTRSDASAAYKTLVDSIDETMSSFSPIDIGGITAMAAAIGNPVAVVRAQLTLTLHGSPALSQLPQDIGAGNSGNLDSFVVPVKLGSLSLSQDGLLGYFLNGDFTTLLTPATSTGTDFALSFVAGKNSADLLLLMDPRGVAHAATGLLPVGVLKLPPGVTDAPLRQMAVTFEIGPVLTDPSTVTLPLPALGRGTWTWLDRPTVASWSGDVPIAAADAKPRLPTTPPIAAEGWLKLSNSFGKTDSK